MSTLYQTRTFKNKRETLANLHHTEPNNIGLNITETGFKSCEHCKWLLYINY